MSWCRAAVLQCCSVQISAQRCKLNVLHCAAAGRDLALGTRQQRRPIVRWVGVILYSTVTRHPGPIIGFYYSTHIKLYLPLSLQSNSDHICPLCWCLPRQSPLWTMDRMLRMSRSGDWWPVLVKRSREQKLYWRSRRNKGGLGSWQPSHRFISNIV